MIDPRAVIGEPRCGSSPCGGARIDHAPCPTSSLPTATRGRRGFRCRGRQRCAADEPRGSPIRRSRIERSSSSSAPQESRPRRFLPRPLGDLACGSRGSGSTMRSRRCRPQLERAALELSHHPIPSGPVPRKTTGYAVGVGGVLHGGRAHLVRVEDHLAHGAEEAVESLAC